MHTKRDIGACKKEHNEFHVREMEKHPDKETWRKKWMPDMIPVLEQLAAETKRLVDRERRALEANSDVDMSWRMTTKLQAKYDAVMKEAQEMAESGQIAESNAKMERAKGLETRIKEVRAIYDAERHEAKLCDI